ncbi:MAG: hypothetical protein HEQ39_09845 [Rhizobacter sp.]
MEPIEINQVWLTRGGETVTVVATNPDDLFPVKVERHGYLRMRFYVRADGTANPRPGVDDADDLVRRLS